MIVREAGPDDLSSVYDVWYATETEGLAAPPPPGTMPWLAHLRQVGRLVVAVDDRAVVGFAGALDHGCCVALSDLFVRPERQSQGIGTALLDAVLPPGRPLVTMASADPRAVASYVRRGMRPRWPAFSVHAASADIRDVPDPAGTELDVAPLALDAYHWQLCGDEAHYERLGARPVVVRDGDRELGTALVLTGSPQRLAHPDAAELLESSAHEADDAAALVLAVVAQMVTAGATRVIAQVPGPHGALRPLLDRGFAITDTDLACATADGLLADPSRHTMHGEPRVRAPEGSAGRA
jgi:GNAT superfamily N-acetyltransferase